MIQNCGKTYKCPKKWESFKETPNSKIRHCSECERPVYLCTSQDEITIFGRAGECIAVQKEELSAPFERSPKESFYKTLEEQIDFPDWVVCSFANCVDPDNVMELTEAIYKTKNPYLINFFNRWYENAPETEDEWESLMYIIAGSFTEDFDPDVYSRNCRQRDKYAVTLLRNADVGSKTWLEKLFKNKD